MGEEARARVVAALLRGKRKRRGRPRKDNFEDLDTKRAFIVVWCFQQYPGRFRTRREVIEYLQRISRAANCVSEALELEGMELELRESLRQFSTTFPLRELEQSVSRGMNKNGGLLRALEELAKK